ncbi:MAG: DUF4157 domain-containing protein [Anditalea sp.]
MSFEAVNTATKNTPALAGDVQPLSAQNDALPQFETKLKKHEKGLIIQPKLTVDVPDDPYEKEADAVADKVMRMPEESFVQRKTEEEEEPIQLKRNEMDSFIQKKCAECEQEDEEIHRKPLNETVTPFLQTKSEGNTTVSEGITNSIHSSKGSGATLDDQTHSFMSDRFGSDFSSVKIHTDSESVQLNRNLNAKAFTVGNDVYFNEGQYQPGSSEGKQLLAHELTHVVQQGGGIHQRIQKISKNPQDVPFEGEIIPWSTPLRPAPNKIGKPLIDVPRGHKVTVLGGNAWIKVSTELNGKPYEGYISHELIRKSTTTVSPSATPSPIQAIEQQLLGDLQTMLTFHSSFTAKLNSLDQKGVDPNLTDPVVEHGIALKDNIDNAITLAGYIASLPQEQRELIISGLTTELRLFTQSVKYLETLDKIIDINVPTDAISNDDKVEEYLGFLTEEISAVVMGNSVWAEIASEATEDLINSALSVSEETLKSAFSMLESTIDAQNADLKQIASDTGDLIIKIDDAVRTYNQTSAAADIAEIIILILSRGRARRAKAPRTPKRGKTTKTKTKTRKSLRKPTTPSKTRQRKQRRKKSSKTRKKPLQWINTTNVKNVTNSGGIVGALDYNYTLPAGFTWHAHHSWPKFLGGWPGQRLMGIRELVHISIVHPALLVYLKSLGHNVLGNQPATHPTNATFVLKLRTDLAFRGLVMAELIAFYTLINQKTEPQIPANAYTFGIRDSFAKF